MSVKKVGKAWSFHIDAGTDSRTGKRKQIYRSGFTKTIILFNILMYANTSFELNC
ncbi:MAG: Arm DNA-binding domain-containing protein [Romboutsia timonensis]